MCYIHLFWQCYSYCVRMCKAESLQICRKKLENMVLKMGWIIDSNLECIQQKITDRLTDWLLISDKDKDKHRHKHKKHWERFRDFVTI